MPALSELEAAYQQYRNEPAFQQELQQLLRDYVGRHSPISLNALLLNMPDRMVRGQIYLKREDLNHTGSHKINNALGQVLLARRMGKQRIIAETELVSTVSLRQQCVLGSGWTVLFTWACTIWSGRA
jgi:tryptophan synthase beta chain